MLLNVMAVLNQCLIRALAELDSTERKVELGKTIMTLVEDICDLKQKYLVVHQKYFVSRAKKGLSGDTHGDESLNNESC